MRDALSIIVQILTGFAALVAAITAILNKFHIQRTGARIDTLSAQINGQQTMIVESAEKIARAAGVKQEQDEQAAREASARPARPRKPI